MDSVRVRLLLIIFHTKSQLLKLPGSGCDSLVVRYVLFPQICFDLRNGKRFSPSSSFSVSETLLNCQVVGDSAAEVEVSEVQPWRKKTVSTRKMEQWTTAEIPLLGAKREPGEPAPIFWVIFLC